jgi:hypothetical protein
MLGTKDFTLQRYIQYLEAIKRNYTNIIRFDEYFLSDPMPGSFCMIRHDVDRKPFHALKMAMIEYEKGIRSTYFFRTKFHTFKPDIIKSIANLGHEIGYHYECLSDSHGDIDKALQDFSHNLQKINKIYPVKTITMHGRPLSRFNNSDMWEKMAHRHSFLSNLGILADVYLDIDYTDIAYINDTGRNWSSSLSNIRDKVTSRVSADFESGETLYNYLLSNPHPKLVVLTHPERWSWNSFDFFTQLCKDSIINIVKGFLKRSR